MLNKKMTEGYNKISTASVKIKMKKTILNK